MKLLIDSFGKKYLVKNNLKKFSTKSGEITISPKNKVIESHLGEKFYQVDARYPDIFNKMRKGPQTILLKDAAIIAAFSGIDSSSKVVDAGTGAGWLVAYLAKQIFPKKIISYERNKEFIEIAKNNFELIGTKNVIIKNKDIYTSFSEKDIDLLTLDLPEPWNVDISRVKIGGFVVSYLPQMTQVVEFVNYCTKKGFLVEHVFENQLREWKVEDKIARPKFKQLDHTAFLVFARKVD